MLSESFRLFFADPLKGLFGIIRNDISYILRSLKLLLMPWHIVPEDRSRILERTRQGFEMIMKVIFLSILVGQFNERLNQSLLVSLIVETLFLLSFYVLFIILYYLSVLFERMLKCDKLCSFGISVWQSYTFLFAILRLVNGIIDPESIENREGYELFGGVLIVVALHYTYVWIVAIAKGILPGKSVFYHIVFTPYLVLSQFVMVVMTLVMTMNFI